jgi:hypothetical protein
MILKKYTLIRGGFQNNSSLLSFRKKKVRQRKPVWGQIPEAFYIVNGFA